MAISLFQHGAIRTTEAKAKDLRPFVERLISHARKGTVHARRLVSAELGNRRGDRGVLMNNEGEPQDRGVLDVLFNEIAPRYADRPGGYTRIIRLAERRLGDGGKQVILQLVEESASRGGGGGGSRRKRRGVKRREALAAASRQAPAPEAEQDETSRAAETPEVSEAPEAAKQDEAVEQVEAPSGEDETGEDEKQA